jgi:type IV pilus assembly protein PilM
MAQVIAGLDIGAEAVKVARLRVGFRQVELEQIRSLPLNEDPWPQVVDEIRAADFVVSCLPGDQLSQRMLQLPRAVQKRLEQVIPHQLDGEIPFDIDEVVIAHRVEAQEGDQLHVLALAAARHRVEGHLSDLAEVGIVPRQVGAGPVALAALARVAYGEETVALVDIGDQRTDVVIVRQGKFVHGRTLAVASGALTTSLATTLQVSREEARAIKHNRPLLTMGAEHEGDDTANVAALEAVRPVVNRFVRELRQTLASPAVSGGEPVQRLVLVGGGSRLRGLDIHLEQELGLPVGQFLAPDNVANADRFDVREGAKALALALQGAWPRGERINLRQGAFAGESEVRIGRGVLLYAAALVVILMGSWGFSAFARSYALDREKESQYEQLAQRSKAILGQEINSFTKLRSLVAQSAEQNKALSPLPTKDAFDVVEQISQRIPQTINHEVEQLDIRSGRVQLKGRVDQRRDADEIMEALGQWEECFTKVPVPRTTPAVRDKRLQYTMDIETRCP